MLMRTEVIYSIAALAAFPVAANAQVDVKTIGKVTLSDNKAEKPIDYKDDNDTKQLIKGKYKITSDAIAGTANSSIKVAVKNGGTPLNLNGINGNTEVTVSVGSQINVTFEIGETTTVDDLKLYITDGSGVTVVTNVKVALDLKVAKIYSTLFGEYNSYINYLYNVAEWDKKDSRLDLREKISALATYKYTDYVEDNSKEEGAYSLYALIGKEDNEEAVFTTSKLGIDIRKAEFDLKVAEYTYLKDLINGTDEKSLISRYNKLQDGISSTDIVDYQSTPEDIDLGTKKSTAEKAITSLDDKNTIQGGVITATEITANDLDNFREAKNKYENALEYAENVKKDNESAYNNLLSESTGVTLEKVGKYPSPTGEATTTYKNVETAIKASSTDTKYANLRTDALAILQKAANGDEVTKGGYDTVLGKLNESRKNKTAKADSENLQKAINEYAQTLNQVNADFITDKGTLDAAYAKLKEKQDEFAEATKNLPTNAPVALSNARNEWDNAIIDLKTRIELPDNNKHAGISNLKESNTAYANILSTIAEKKTAFENKQQSFTAYFAALSEVAEQSTALKNVIVDIDADAFNKGLLKKNGENYVPTADGEYFRPSEIWLKNIEAIEKDDETNPGLINKLTEAVTRGVVNDEGKYNKPEKYEEDLQAIKDAITALQTNVKNATSIYAKIKTQVDKAKGVLDQIDKESGGKSLYKDLQDLHVWQTPITAEINADAAKRTPYVKYIEKAPSGGDPTATGGSIRQAVAKWQENLTAAKRKTAAYPEDENKKDNILNYLNDIAPKPADVLKESIAILEGIRDKYTTDEGYYDKQIDHNNLSATLSLVEEQITATRAAVKVLQDIIDNDKAKEGPEDRVIGLKNGEVLQNTINTINNKINNVATNAQTAYKDQKLNDLNTQLSKIQDILTKDIVNAQTEKDNYSGLYGTFLTNYNSLKGTKDVGDQVGKNTLEGLKKYAKDAKSYIDEYYAVDKTHTLPAIVGYLNETLRTKMKTKVDNVSWQQAETANTPAVTYKIDNVSDAIRQAENFEVLTAENLTKWQDVISNLKGEIDEVKAESGRLNGLEESLDNLYKAIVDAKGGVLKVDDNEEGYFYKQLTGKYTTDYNNLKATVESKDNITVNDVNGAREGSLAKQIQDKITEVAGTGTTGVGGVVDNAKKDKNALDAAEKAYSHEKDSSDKTDNGGAVQQYDEWNAKLVAKPETNQLGVVRTDVDTQKAELDELIKEARDAYAKGKCAGGKKVNGQNKAYNVLITEKIAAIITTIEKYLDPTYYNAYVTADNTVIYNDAVKAGEAAQDAYNTAASVINTYNNFKSTELKKATQQAEAELEALYAVLRSFDDTKADITERLTSTYTSTISPEKFDTDSTFKAEFVALEKEVVDATKALTDKISEKAGSEVATSVDKYTNAIAEFKAKLEEIYAEEELDLSKDEQKGTLVAIANEYKEVNGALETITTVQNDLNKVNELDAALVVAESGVIDIRYSTIKGILNFIDAREKTRATSVLKVIHGNSGNSYDEANFSVADYNDYLDIYYTIYDKKKDANGNIVPLDETKDKDQIAQNAEDRVKNFSSIKQRLENRLADILDNRNIEEAKTAIKDALGYLSGIESDIYNKYAAASDERVKSIFDEIRGTDPDKGIGVEVTANNAKALKSRAEKISETIGNTAAAEDKDERIAAIYDALYDAELDLINGSKGLIEKAETRLLTYTGSDKDTQKAKLQTEKDKLIGTKDEKGDTEIEGVTEKVANEKWTKKQALGEGAGNSDVTLKTIETALNTILNTIDQPRSGGSDINGTLKTTYEDILEGQKKRLEGINEEYEPVISAAINEGEELQAESDAIYKQEDNSESGKIADLQKFIDKHASSLEAYLKNLQDLSSDITKAINDYEQHVKDVKDKTLTDVWKASEEAIEKAEEKVANLKAELFAYGNTADYVNKLADLDNQIADAKETLEDEKANVNELSLDELIKRAENATEDDGVIAKALAGIDGNVTNINDLAKGAYINAEIGALKNELKDQKYIKTGTNGLTGTWVGDKENYTTTDQASLTAQLTALTTELRTLDTKAKEAKQAEDISDKEADKGVITIIAEGKQQFEKDLAALTKAVKDKRLTQETEDQRGHVATDTDEDISTKDLSALINIILNGEEDSANKDACDINGDGEIDIVDVSWLRYYLVYEEWPETDRRNARQLSNGNIDKVELQVVSTANNVTRVAFNLTNETEFENFQFDIVLPAGAKVVGKSLGERVENGNLLVNQNENSVRVLGISNWNKSIAGEEGAVFYLDIENLNGDLTTEQAIFTDTNLVGRNLLDGSETTGIRQKITNLIESAGERIYDLGGRISNGIKNGIKIIKKGDGTTKKVVSNK